ncbi:MAG: hypothetical protein U5O39_17245 [Gammaproteobacteria bacterium]|nr:hypothetical protein [Gammaproteobacteria bacterium]
MVEALPTGYYLDNFQIVLDQVARCYPDLLAAEEHRFLLDFHYLSLDARRLYVRLYGRKGPLFRDDTLCYPEIPDIRGAAAELVRGKFADDAPEADAADLLALLRKPELATLAGGALPRTARRPDLLDWLRDQYAADEVRVRLGFRVLRLLRTPTLDVFKLLYFGNLDQDFTEFILSDLGITPYEDYALDPGHRCFETRETIDRTCRLYALRALARDHLDALSGTELLALADATPRIDEPVMDHRAGRLLARVGRQLERLGDTDAALAVFERTNAAPSRERCTRLHANRGEDAKALELCWQILTDPEDESEYDFAVRFAHRHARRIRASLPGWPALPDVSYCKRAMCLEPTGDRVEESVRGALSIAGTQAWYVENALFTGLFGLAFWDIIFQGLPGAFVHPFQRGPLDLFTPAFRTRRRDQIDTRLREMTHAPALAARIFETWKRAIGAPTISSPGTGSRSTCWP